MDSDIHNWYEKLVREKLIQMTAEGTFDSLQVDEEKLLDIACVALNRLPPRYVRHTVDMSFYMGMQEQEKMDASVQLAIEESIDFVANKAWDFQHENIQTDNVQKG